MQNLQDSFSDSLLLEILSMSKDAVAVYSTPDLHIRFASDAMLAIWGKDSNVIGKTLEAAVPELEGQPFVGLMKNVWNTGVTHSGTGRAADLHVDGKLQTFYFDYEYRAVTGKDGRTICVLHTATNVTDRLKAQRVIAEKATSETRLRLELAASNQEMQVVNNELKTANETLVDSSNKLAESQNHLSSIMDKAPIGICILKGHNHIIEVANETILKAWGRTAEQVLGKPHHDARPELKGQEVYQWLDEVFETGVTKINNEISVMLKEGEGLRQAYVNSVYQATRGKNGEITGVVVILEDITEKVIQRREADRIQDMFNLAVKAGEMGTFYYDPRTNLFSANETLKGWFGLPGDRKMDLTLALNAIVPEDRQKVVDGITRALLFSSGGQYETEYTIIHPETQQPRMVKAKGRAFFDNDKNAVSLNGTLIDITEPKREQQRKNDFIAMVSHELKTPLSSMKLYLQLLQQHAGRQRDPVASGTLVKAVRQVKKMIGMINSFLNVSRLEAGKMRVDKLVFDMKDMLAEIEEETQTTITSHTITYSSENVLVNADREKISQVMHNLISNAAKYSATKTTVIINCYREADHAVVTVTDNGIGVKPEDQERLFEQYYRVEADKGESVSGFGIGLYLSSEIIARHDGKIWVESEPGKGSTFLFKIPAINMTE
jgi:two-component system, OmpR family, sensor histidine kinase VicK